MQKLKFLLQLIKNMEKIDHKEIYKEIYKIRKNRINIIDIPKRNFLIVTGYGHPSEKMFQDALQEIKEKDKNLPLKQNLKFKSHTDGKNIITLHVGDYKKMNQTLKKMKKYASDLNLQTANDTHYIYLNEVRKTKPENLKTIMLLKVL